MLVADEIAQFPLAIADNAVGPEGEDLRTALLQNLRQQGSVFWDPLLYYEAQAKLSALEFLRDNWDTYRAPAPNRVALSNGLRILNHMRPFDLSVAKIVPSAEGGVGFCFVIGERYADIEASNEGDIIGVRYIGKQPPVLIPVEDTDDSIERALAQIRDHLSA